MAAAVRVIGIGNAYRSDDGAGLAVASALQRRSLTRVTILTHSGDGASLMDAFQTDGPLILADAARSGAPPGSVRRFDARTDRIPSSFFANSTHQFGVFEAIEMARTLDQLPSRLIIYAIEGKTFAPGTHLSPEIESAIHIVADRISNECAALMGD